VKPLISLGLVCAVGAIIWGEITSAERPFPRSSERVLKAGPEWYAALPKDPSAATAAYLQRVPREIRERGEVFSTSRYKALFCRVASLIGFVAFIMFSGATARMVAFARRVSSRTWLIDTLVALQVLIVLYLLNLPVETYAGFVRLHDAGFSQRTYLDWLSEATLDWAVLTVFYTVGIVVIMALIRSRPGSWVGWATVVYFVLSGAYIVGSPLYIEPLFNRMTPLAEGTIKQRILSLARANGVPVDNVFVRDASHQSVLLDAHVSGFAGTAQIVLDDNTIADTPQPEVEFVMAHEIGHYALAHVPKELVLDTLLMGLGFLFISWSSRRLIGRFGSHWGINTLADTSAIPLFWGLFLLWGFISLPLSNSITREQEAEADNYGINASRQPLGLADFMIRDADTARLDPTPIEEWLFYNHPSIRNRIFAAMEWRAEHLGSE
jgi:STE24 endopeptidase